MPIKVKVLQSQESTVTVKTRRPAWQEFIHY